MFEKGPLVYFIGILEHRKHVLGLRVILFDKPLLKHYAQLQQHNRLLLLCSISISTEAQTITAFFYFTSLWKFKQKKYILKDNIMRNM